MTSLRPTARHAALAALVPVCFGVSAAQAAIVSGYSEGQALQLSVVPLLLGTPINIGLPQLAAGTFPGNYDQTNTILTANVSGNVISTLLANLQATVLTANANGNANAVTGSSDVAREGATVDLNTGAVDLGLNEALRVLGSDSTVSWNGTQLVASGSSVVTGLNLNSVLTALLGIQVNNSLLANVNLSSDTLGFNVDVFDLLGLSSLTTTLGVSLIFNEQITVCEADFLTCNIETNALHLKTLGVIGSVFNIDLVLGHSYAEARAERDPSVPEPAALGLLGLGAVALAFVRRRKAV